MLEVTNDNSEINQSTQNIVFDAQHNPSTITEGSYEWSFEYGPNHQRKKAIIRNLETEEVHTRYYTVNAEYEYRGENLRYQVDYISGGGELTALAVTDGNSRKTSIYAVYTDHLGSIELITDEEGGQVARLSYDAWGRYRDPETWITYTDNPPNKPDWLWRGYTGHEYMEEFQLINMNGRLYDPLLGRMLSPDNYVQNSTSQHYNRYSYVLNNPLKYTDPSGEIICAPIIIGAIIGGYIGGASAEGTGDMTAWKYNDKTWGGIAGGALVGAASGAMGGAIITSGMAFANTASIVATSYTSSVGMSAVSGSQAGVSVGFGFGSYNLTSGEFGYLGKKENSTLENIGYGLGTLANVADIMAGFKPGSVELRTENTSSPGNKDNVGHSQIVNENGTPLVDWGPDEQLYKDNAFRSVRGTNSYEKGLAIPSEDMKWDALTIDGVNTSRISNWNPTGKYNLGFNSCVTQTSRALNSSGVFNVGIHPYLLHGQMYLRSIGVRPYLFSSYMYQY